MTGPEVPRSKLPGATYLPRIKSQHSRRPQTSSQKPTSLRASYSITSSARAPQLSRDVEAERLRRLEADGRPDLVRRLYGIPAVGRDDTLAFTDLTDETLHLTNIARR